jgi:repressor LexA
MKLTDTQRAMLALIVERIEAEGMPPSQVEIARAFGFSGVRAAQYHLEALEAAGAIERVPGRARGIRLRKPLQNEESPSGLEPGVEPERNVEETMRLPVLGKVSAGSPIASGAYEFGEPDAYVLLDIALFSPAPDYLLRVSGDSMRDEGILDGDLIGVRRTRDARAGQIVVASIDEEITVKQFKPGATGIRLLPRNPDYAPIDVRPDQEFAIEGLYCGLIRPNR